MRLERFGRVYTFPIYTVTDRLGQGRAPGNITNTMAGAYDSHGSDDVVTGQYNIRRTCEILETTPALTQTALDLARSLRGTKEKLWARTYSSPAEVRWSNGRCVSVDYNRTARNFSWQVLDFNFELLTTHWNGHNHSTWTLDDTPQVYLDEAYYLDEGGFTATLSTSPYTITVTNGGNKAVTNPIITIAAGTTAVTNLLIRNTTNSLSHFEWGALGDQIQIGESLVFDCGAFSVLNNGVDAYNDLSISASNHKIGSWIQLDPGDNDIEIIATSASLDHTVTVSFADGWH